MIVTGPHGSKHSLMMGDGTSYKSGLPNCLFDPMHDSYQKPTEKYVSLLAFTDGVYLRDTIALLGGDIRHVFVWDNVTSYFTGKKRPLKRHKLVAWYANADAPFNYNGYFTRREKPHKRKIVTNSRGTYDLGDETRGLRISDLYKMPRTKGPRGYWKPPEWVKWMVGSCCVGPVYDPYAGQGGFALAMADLGRESTHVFIDEDALSACANGIETLIPTPPSSTLAQGEGQGLLRLDDT